MLLTKAAIADSHFICTVPSHVGRVESFPSVQVTSLSPLKVNPVSQVTVYLLPEAIVAEVGVTVASEIVGLLQELAESTILLRKSYSNLSSYSRIAISRIDCSLNLTQL